MVGATTVSVELEGKFKAEGAEGGFLVWLALLLWLLSLGGRVIGGRDTRRW